MKRHLSAILFTLVCLVPFAQGQSTTISLPQGGQAGTQFYASVIWSPAQGKFVLRDSADGKTAAAASGTGNGAAGTAVTVSTTDVTTSGTVSAGSRGLIFIFRTGFTGTVNGVAWAATTDASYQPIIPPSTTGPAIVYTVTAGTLRISDTR